MEAFEMWLGIVEFEMLRLVVLLIRWKLNFQAREEISRERLRYLEAMVGLLLVKLSFD